MAARLLRLALAAAFASILLSALVLLAVLAAGPAFSFARRRRGGNR